MYNSIRNDMLGILENDTLAQAKKMSNLVGGITEDLFCSIESDALAQSKNMASLIGGIPDDLLCSTENNVLSQVKEMARLGVTDNLLYSIENSALAQANTGSQISLFMERANKLNIAKTKFIPDISFSTTPFEVEKLF